MNKNQIIKILVLISAVGALCYVLNMYVNKKSTPKRTANIEKFSEPTKAPISPAESAGNNEIFQNVSEPTDDEFGLNGNQYPKDCFPKDQLTPGELLPGDANSKWSQSVPAGQGELGDQNFLTAGHHIGTNTVGQTLRNANRQLRSEPPNPQVKVSPWLQTTIEYDANRKPLEIGSTQ
tara:strand:- start:1060 stop:1593 length:534 start_codon:yes stop_codon:yes gene_type:complete